MSKKIIKIIIIFLITLTTTICFRKEWWYEGKIPNDLSSNNREYGYEQWRMTFVRSNHKWYPARYGSPNPARYVVFHKPDDDFFGNYEYYNGSYQFNNAFTPVQFSKIPYSETEAWQRFFYIDNDAKMHLPATPWVLYDITYDCHCMHCCYFCINNCVSSSETEVKGKLRPFSCVNDASSFFNNDNAFIHGGSGNPDFKLYYDGSILTSRAINSFIDQDISTVITTNMDSESPECTPPNGGAPACGQCGESGNFKIIIIYSFAIRNDIING